DAARLEPLELDAESRGIAGIDDDGLACVACRADDIGVRPDRSQLVAIDREAHGLVSLLLRARLGSRRCRAGTCARSKRPAAVARPSCCARTMRLVPCCSLSFRVRSWA